MVKQYPYRLWVLTTSGGGKDANGDHEPQTETWTDLVRCRDEVNAKRATITLEDGTDYPFDSLIQLPKGSYPNLTNGASIEVRESDGTVRVKGEVQRIIRAQLHSQLWV